MHRIHSRVGQFLLAALVLATAASARQGRGSAAAPYYRAANAWQHRTPESAFYHLGDGNNIIYVDREHDLVIVARWMNNLRTMDAMVKLLAGT